MIQAAVMETGWLEAESAQDFFAPMVSRRCREKLRRVRPAGARACSLGAELLLRSVLARLGIPTVGELEEQPGGKPFFPEAPCLCFNVSHSGAWAACVVSSRAAGVDIQEIRPLKADVAGRYFSRWEQEYIQKAENPEKAFIEIWALRESYMKKTGEGLALPLESFSVGQGRGPLLPQHTWPDEGDRTAWGEAFQVIRNGQPQPERFWLREPVTGYMMAICGQEEMAPRLWQTEEKEVKELFGWNGPN